MEQNSYYLAAKSLSKLTTRSANNDQVFLNVMKHNLRELAAEIGVKDGSNIDVNRIHLNLTISGHGTNADEHASYAREQISANVKKVASNASLGIECVFSLANGLPIDYEEYFREATNWACQFFGIPLLSSIIHNDEECPHCHVVFLSIKVSICIKPAIDFQLKDAVLFHPKVPLICMSKRPSIGKEMIYFDRIVPSR